MNLVLIHIVVSDDFFDGFSGVRIQVGMYIVHFGVKFQ